MAEISNRSTTFRVSFAGAAVLNLGYFIFSVLRTSHFTQRSDIVLVGLGAAYSPRFPHGEWWRLLTASFLNNNLFALIASLACLYLLSKIADFLDEPSLFATYLLGGALSFVVAMRLFPFAVLYGSVNSIILVYGASLGYRLVRNEIAAIKDRWMVYSGLLFLSFPVSYLSPTPKRTFLITFLSMMLGFVFGSVLASRSALKKHILFASATTSLVAILALAASLPRQPDLLMVNLRFAELKSNYLKAHRFYREQKPKGTQADLSERKTFIEKQMIGPLQEIQTDIGSLVLKYPQLEPLLAADLTTAQLHEAQCRFELTLMTRFDGLVALDTKIKSHQIRPDAASNEIAARWLPALNDSVADVEKIIRARELEGEEREVAYREAKKITDGFRVDLISRMAFLEAKAVQETFVGDVRKYFTLIDQDKSSTVSQGNSLRFLDTRYVDDLRRVKDRRLQIAKYFSSTDENSVEVLDKKIAAFQNAYLIFRVSSSELLATRLYGDVVAQVLRRKMTITQSLNYVDKKLNPIFIDFQNRRPSSTEMSVNTQFGILEKSRSDSIKELKEALLSKNTKSLDLAAQHWQALNNSALAMSVPALLSDIRRGIPK